MSRGYKREHSRGSLQRAMFDRPKRGLEAFFFLARHVAPRYHPRRVSILVFATFGHLRPSCCLVKNFSRAFRQRQKLFSSPETPEQMHPTRAVFFSAPERINLPCASLAYSRSTDGEVAFSRPLIAKSATLTECFETDGRSTNDG